MKRSRLITALAVPVVIAFGLVACSDDTTPDEPTINETTSNQEKETTSDDENKTDNEAKGEDNVSILTSDKDERSEEGAVKVVNAFYEELSDDSRFEELDEVMEAEYPGWAEADEAPDAEAEQFALDSMNEIYGDLISRVDDEGMDDETIEIIVGSIVGSSQVYAMMGDVMPPAELAVEDIDVTKNTAIFKASDLYDLEEMGIEEEAMVEDGELKLNYKDGRWLFAPESMMI